MEPKIEITNNIIEGGLLSVNTAGKLVLRATKICLSKSSKILVGRNQTTIHKTLIKDANAS